MNSVGDEAIRRELLARLHNAGAGMSGGRRYTGGMSGGKGPSEKSKAHAGKNPYIQFLKEIRRKPLQGEYDNYLASKGLLRTAPKVRSGKPKGRPKKVKIAPVITPATIKKIIKMYNCNPPNINNPKTGRCLKPTSRLGRQVGNPLKILNPNTGRYVLRRGKIGKLLGGTVYE